MHRILAAMFILVSMSATATLAQGDSASPAPSVGAVVATGKWGTLWSCTSTFKVMRNTPLPTAKLAVVELSAARNEYEPFQLVLRPTAQLTNVKVTPHTLTGPGGAKIEAWNISTRNVEYLQVTKPTSEGIAPGMYPDPLPEHQPFTAPTQVNSPVWVTVYVPTKAAPGEYKGTVDISADGMGKVAVPLKLRVWNFALPTVSNLRTAYGSDLERASAFHGASTLEQKRKLTELYNLEFWRHRVAPYSPYTFYDIKAELAGGTVKLDFTDFDIAVSKFFPLFNSFNLPYFGAKDNAGLDMGSEYPRLKVDYMRAVTEHLAAKGQISKAYNNILNESYVFIEPEPENYDTVKEAAKLCAMADSRIKVLLTEQVEPDLIDSVDIWVPLISNYNETAAKQRQAKGEEVWWHVGSGPHSPYPNNFIDYPAIDHRVLHWITWRYGLNGILYWQTMYWRDNPWETVMSYTPDGEQELGNGTGTLLYPPVRKPSEVFAAKGPVPSMRWELIREGVEDYDYFYMLKQKIEAARKAGRNDAADKAAKALELVNSVAQSRTEYTKDPTKLEQVRIEVAEAIESLN